MFSVRTSWDQRCARPHSKWGIWTNSSRSERGSAACMANSRCGRSAWCGPPQGDTGRSDKTAPRDCWCAVWNEKKKQQKEHVELCRKDSNKIYKEVWSLNWPLAAHSPSPPKCLDQWSGLDSPDHQLPQTGNWWTKGKYTHQLSILLILSAYDNTAVHSVSLHVI